MLPDRHVEKRGIKGRHAGEHRNAKVRGDLPEPGDDLLAPIALRRTEHDVIALHPRQQSGDDLRVHMEERQSAEDGALGGG